MIIVGDIASPSDKCSEKLTKIFMDHKDIFSDNILIANLEGLICDNQSTDGNLPLLFNDASVLTSLKAAATKALTLANNHTLDFPQYFSFTTDILLKNNISFAGAGKTKVEAEKPAVFYEGNSQVILFTACFNFLLYNHHNPKAGVYVAEINEKKLIKEIKLYRENFPEAGIVVYFHWSIDHESLPYPMYRNFSRKLIDIGANIIVGSHAHCVQGGEKYKEGYIVYGLGNFFLPQNIYAGGKLSFPESSNIQLALEWDMKANEAICHWFKYNSNNDNHRLELLESEVFESSKYLDSYTPYKKMTDREYIRFFKKNRTKKILIPLYKNYENTNWNSFSTFFLKNRARLARLLAKKGIIKWQK